MPERPSITLRPHKRQKARGRQAAAIGGIVVAVIIVVGAGIFLARGREPQTSLATQTSSTTSSTPKAAGTPADASSDATSGISRDTLRAAAASVKAATKAAVPYPGAPPLSPTTPSVSQLKPRHKYVALTIDDGYNFQPKMLEFLKEHDVHCTTFLIGSWAATHKQDLKLLRAAGFEIGNHSWTHPFLTKLSTSQVQSELRRTQSVISSVTGNQAPYLRPPYGDTDARVKAAAAALGYRIVLWNRSFGDSGGHPSANHVTKIVTRDGGIQPGDVILCHWGSKGTYEALQTLLPKWQAQGFQFVTISELIADSEPTK